MTIQTRDLDRGSEESGVMRRLLDLEIRFSVAFPRVSVEYSRNTDRDMTDPSRLLVSI